MKCKVLIIDDEQINLVLLEEFVHDFDKDIETISVDSAAKGLFYYFTNNIDLVFLDIVMANINGKDFIDIVEENMKAGLLNCCPNIVVQTAMPSDVKINLLAKKKCVLEVIRKPITKQHIHDCLTHYCIERNGCG